MLLIEAILGRETKYIPGNTPALGVPNGVTENASRALASAKARANQLSRAGRLSDGDKRTVWLTLGDAEKHLNLPRFSLLVPLLSGMITGSIIRDPGIIAPIVWLGSYISARYVLDAVPISSNIDLARAKLS